MAFQLRQNVIHFQDEGPGDLNRKQMGCLQADSRVFPAVGQQVWLPRQGKANWHCRRRTKLNRCFALDARSFWRIFEGRNPADREMHPTANFNYGQAAVSNTLFPADPMHDVYRGRPTSFTPE